MDVKKVKTLTLPIEGMTCASCVTRVEKTLDKIDGVDKVNVNLATEEVTFNLSGESADLQKIAEVVEESGYKLNLPAQSIDENGTDLKGGESGTGPFHRYDCSR